MQALPKRASGREFMIAAGSSVLALAERGTTLAFLRERGSPEDK